MTQAASPDLRNTDEYRGLDVDRTFLKYLDRKVDPGGRTYWINSIRNGRELWRFRAQLFGSNEYFTKAGGTNKSSPTGEQQLIAALAAGADSFNRS